jgi:hypothetical protein
MTPNNTDEQIRHVFDEWHRAVKDQDAEGMAALYAHDGTLETPAVLALWPERDDASCTAETPSRGSSRKASRRAAAKGSSRTGSAAGGTSPTGGC